MIDVKTFYIFTFAMLFNIFKNFLTFLLHKNQ